MTVCTLRSCLNDSEHLCFEQRFIDFYSLGHFIRMKWFKRCVSIVVTEEMKNGWIISVILQLFIIMQEAIGVIPTDFLMIENWKSYLLRIKDDFRTLPRWNEVEVGYNYSIFCTNVLNHLLDTFPFGFSPFSTSGLR